MDGVLSIVNSLHIRENVKFTPSCGHVPNIGVNFKYWRRQKAREDLEFGLQFWATMELIVFWLPKLQPELKILTTVETQLYFLNLNQGEYYYINLKFHTGQN